MTISSRTPEGLPSQCPLCGTATMLEFSDPGDDAPCPNCGSLLLRSTALLDRLRQKIAEVLGVSLEQVTVDSSLTELGADSLDLVELVMELEEDFDFSIPDEDAESIRTIGDFVRYFERRMRRAGPSGDA